MFRTAVNLLPIINKINLPTVLKTAIFPGDNAESLFVATQVGEIFYIRNGFIGTFLDIRPRILKLGTLGSGYDERGLLGLAFHPEFSYNGLFYLHYSIAGSQGPGAISGSFHPNPCYPESMSLKWSNRESQFNHIDTVEEWALQQSGQPRKQRTLLSLRRPFLNHNGVNSLNFSPENGRLVLTTGDGGLAYDPFNLSQDIMEIAGKIVEIDVSVNASFDNQQVVTRFNELPIPVQEMLTVIAKGVRNIPGISYQRINNRYIKYIGNVGQDLVESIFSFVNYKPIPVSQIVEASEMNTEPDLNGFINFGWRGWEGDFPSMIIGACPNEGAMSEQIVAYYDEAVKTSVQRLRPLTSYYHIDSRQDHFGGTALTGVQAYMGNAIPFLSGNVVFTDLARDEEEIRSSPVRGVLAYTGIKTDCKLNDYQIIDIDYDFGTGSAFYTCLGTNLDQTRLYLGVYGSMNVGDFNQGAIYEIVP